LGLWLFAAMSLPAQYCYQFSGTGTTGSANAGSNFVAKVNIADPPPSAPLNPGIGYIGSFGGGNNTISVTAGQATKVFNQFGVTISYFTGEDTFLSIVGADLTADAVTIQLSGLGNLLPNGPPPTLPPISSWGESATFQYVSGSSVFQGTIQFVGSCGATPPPNAPSITSGGIVPVYSTGAAVESGEWVSIYGTNLASTTATWTGNFPPTLGGTSVTIDGKPAYLWFVSPTQINMQIPDDPATGTVAVVVTTAGGSATATVTLAQFAPAFSLIDAHHVAGIITRSDGSGAHGGGTYDILGPTGTSLGYPTVAAKAGDNIVLFGVGFGPTNPHVPAGQPFSGSAPTTNPVTVLFNNVSVQPSYSGETSSGLYQLNLTVPPGLGSGDVPLQAMVGGIRTQSGVVIPLDASASTPQLKSLSLASYAASASSVTATLTLSSPAPSGGAVVFLSSNSAAVSLPNSVLIAAGSTTATFTVTTGTVATSQIVILTGTYGGVSVQAGFTVTPATAASPFIELIVIPTFQPAGYPSISTATFVVTPDPGNATFTACIDGCDLGTVLINGTTGNQGQTFTFNALQSTQGVILFAGSSTGLLQISSAALTFTLSQTTSSGNIVLGNVTGTLTVTGTPYGAAGNPVTLSGPISGTYSENRP